VCVCRVCVCVCLWVPSPRQRWYSTVGPWVVALTPFWLFRIVQLNCKLTFEKRHCYRLQQTCCNMLQHAATHCNTLQHAETHCNMLRHTATCWLLKYDDIIFRCAAATAAMTYTHCNTLQHTATCCYTLQHAVTHCNSWLLRMSTKFLRAPRPPQP